MLSAVLCLALAVTFIPAQTISAEQIPDLAEIDSVKAIEANYKTAKCEIGTIEKPISGQSALGFPSSVLIQNTEDAAVLRVVHVTNMEFVTKGQILAELDYDPITLDSARQRLELQIVDVRSAIDTQKSQTQKAIADLSRKTDRRSQIEVKKQRAQLDVFVHQKEQAIKAFQKELDEVVDKQQGLKLYAPYDGVVNTNSFLPGRLVEKGTVLMTLYDPMVFYVVINGDDVNTYRYGMEVNVLAAREPIGKARIVSDPSVMKEKTAGKYMAELENKEIDLRRTLSKIITIEAMSMNESGLLTVPNAAVRNEDGKKYVFIVENNQLKKRYVRIGLVGRDKTQILDGVLEGQDVLIN